MCRAKAPIASNRAAAEPGASRHLRLFSDDDSFHGVTTSSMLALHMASVYGAADFDLESRVRALRRQAERREMVRQILIQYREVQDFYREQITQEMRSMDEIQSELRSVDEQFNEQARSRPHWLPETSALPRRRPSLVRRMLKAASHTFHEIGEGFNDLFGEEEVRRGSIP